MPLNASPNKFRTERYDLITEAIPNPGLGIMGSWACPANRVVEIVAVVCLLRNSVVVANRRPYLALESGGLTSHFTVSAVDIGAGVNCTVAFALDVDAQNRLGHGLVIDPLAAAFELKGGENLLIQVYNWDAGDHFTNLRVLYREWRED